MQLPRAFEERMKELLGEEYDEFHTALTDGESVRGLRVNTVKATRDTVKAISDFELVPLDYCPYGFIFSGSEAVGAHPAHHAGMIYMQDPGAMSTLEVLDIAPSAWVIDLCAAPGGKSTQAAAKLTDGGFILSNEYVPKRAKIMVGNFERLGIRNGMITSLDTAEFKKYFKGAFDLCIADVPCSGEGMFRKSEDALTMWSEENVLASAKRGREILENAAPLVKSGGHIIFSTCTYSLEENEMVVDSFLSAHPEYELVPVRDAVRLATADGVQFEGAKCDSLKEARRFYPHKNRGEGQFIALLKNRAASDRMSSILYKGAETPLKRDEEAIVKSFLSDTLTEMPRGRLTKNGENILLLEHDCPTLPRSVFLSGILVGVLRGKNIIPAHQFYSAYGSLFKRKYELSDKPELLSKYLSGEQIPSGNTAHGFTAITYMGAVIGGGKCIGDVINNHYPKGLRNSAI